MGLSLGETGGLSENHIIDGGPELLQRLTEYQSVRLAERETATRLGAAKGILAAHAEAKATLEKAQAEAAKITSESQRALAEAKATADEAKGRADKAEAAYLAAEAQRIKSEEAFLQSEADAEAARDKAEEEASAMILAAMQKHTEAQRALRDARAKAKKG